MTHYESHTQKDEEEDISEETPLFSTIEEATSSKFSLSFHHRLVSALFLANACDAVEVGSIGFILTVYKDQNGNKLSDSEGEFLTAAVFVGMLFGGLMSGIISDNIGRRKCLLASLTTNTTAALLSAASPDTASLIACRVLAGIGVGASVPSVFTLAAEVFPSDKRGEYMTVISSAWMFGSIFTAGVAWILLGDDTQGDRIVHTSWRVFALLCAIPVLLATVACYLICLESPRYLLNAGRKEEATNVLMAMMKQGNVRVRLRSVSTARPASYTSNSSPTNTLLLADGNGEHMKEDIVSTILLQDDSSTISQQCSQGLKWLKRDGRLLISKPYRRPFLALLGIWFSLSFGYYGLATWITVLFDDIGLSNVYSAAFLYAAANLPGNVASYLLVDSIGRKPLLIGSMLAACVFSIAFAFVANDGGGGGGKAMVVITAAMCFNAAATAAWNAINCLSTEHFSTAIRGTTLGLLAACGRLGSISAQFVNGSLQSNIPVLLAVTSGMMLLGAFAGALLPRLSSKQLD